MNRILAKGLLPLLAFGAVPAHALEWQAALRERMVTPTTHVFGGDASLRVKRELADQGFTGFTLETRLEMQSPTASAVYMPPLRSRKVALETMIASIIHAKGEAIFKPLIFSAPQKGVANRMTGVCPASPKVWFQTYGRSVGFLASLAKFNEVAEIVVATGVPCLLQASNRTEWTNMIKDLRRQAGTRTRLSLELSSDADIAALELWQRQDAAGLSEVLGQLDRLRVSASPVQSSGVWDVAATSAQLRTKLARVNAVSGSKELSIANVTVPGCRDHQVVEDEVLCAAGSAYDKASQQAGVNAFFAALSSLPSDVLGQVKAVEFFSSSTDYEPDDTDFDPRFLYYNESLPSLMKQGIERANQLSSASIGSRAPASVGAGAPPPSKTACIFFDQKDGVDAQGRKDILGPIHARLLQNLMGAFPAWNSELHAMSRYQAGQLASCDVAFYLATHYFATVPAAFLKDAVAFSQTKSLVWMNYKFDDLNKAFKAAGQPLSFNAAMIDQPLETPSEKVQDPGFFRYFDYRGETFEKLARWDAKAKRFMASPELALVQITDPSKVQTLAMARHSKDGRKTPYAVREDRGTGSVWYIGDSPFTFVHYEDRYLIFCDLLWDMLGEQAPAGPLGALVRIEDVNPAQNSRDLRWAIDYLTGQNVPFSLAVIPQYANVFGSDFTGGRKVAQPVTEFKDFVGSLRYAKAAGADFVWHGVYHEAGDLISGFDGDSGPDYEFWMYPEDRPLPQDSSDYVLTELEKGERVWKKLGIRPAAWETPHYAASALDNLLFAGLFDWNYHRTLYFWSDIKHGTGLTERHKMMDCVDEACRAERRALAAQTDIRVNAPDFAGQVFPYRIYKDTYGQAIIPETLGMIDYAFFSDNTWRPVSTPDDILRRARLLKVVRGSFASFFWHPDLVSEDLPYYQRHPGHYESVGGKKTLTRVIEGLKDMGYTFRSISDCSLFPGRECRN